MTRIFIVGEVFAANSQFVRTLMYSSYRLFKTRKVPRQRYISSSIPHYLLLILRLLFLKYIFRHSAQKKEKTVVQLAEFTTTLAILIDFGTCMVYNVRTL